jgi:hypothetical protein
VLLSVYVIFCLSTQFRLLTCLLGITHILLRPIVCVILARTFHPSARYAVCRTHLDLCNRLCRQHRCCADRANHSTHGQNYETRWWWFHQSLTNCIPATVCPQHTQVINTNRLCYFLCSHTIVITDLFALYRTHLVMLNRLCSAISSHAVYVVNCVPYIAHILFYWIICVLLYYRTQFVVMNCVPTIAHIWICVTVSVIFANHKWFIRTNCLS